MFAVLNIAFLLVKLLFSSIRHVPSYRYTFVPRTINQIIKINTEKQRNNALPLFTFFENFKKEEKKKESKRRTFSKLNGNCNRSWRNETRMKIRRERGEDAEKK